MKVTVSKVLRDLDGVRAASMTTEAFPSALKAIELMGRHIGMWQGAGAATDIADLIVGTRTLGKTPEEPRDEEDRP